MLRYERIITDEDQKLLELDLVDIKDWIDKAIEGKINSCFKRAIPKYKTFSKEEIINHKQYESRKERDEKELINKRAASSSTNSGGTIRVGEQIPPRQ